MNLPVKRQASRLPRSFPVGTTYVVEGRGGEDGHLRVYSRYLVLPGGRRINVAADFGGAASPRSRGRPLGQNRSKPRSGGPKKNWVEDGTTLQHPR